MDQHAGDENRRDYKKRTPREAAYHAIDGERDYQDETYPNDSTAFAYAFLVEKYATRLKEAIMDQQSPKPAFPKDQVLKYMRKIAALAVRCMEEHGAPLRE